MGSSNFTLNQHIVHVYIHIFSDLVFKNFIYKALVSRGYIFQTKWPDPIIEKILISNKSNIFFSSSSAIQIWLQSKKASMKLSKLWPDMASTIWSILGNMQLSFGQAFQVGKVTIDSLFAICFLYPLQISGLSDKAYVKQFIDLLVYCFLAFGHEAPLFLF